MENIGLSPITLPTRMTQNNEQNVRRGRKLWLWAAGIIVLLVACVVALPYWLGLVLPSILAQAHVKYGSYETSGYARFKLHNVTFASGGTHFQAREVEGLTPTLWLWKKNRSPQQTFVNVSDWTLSFEKNTNAPATNSLLQTLNKAEGKMKSVHEWVGLANLTNGVVTVANTNIPIPSALWSNGNLQATVIIPRLNQPATVAAQLGPRFPWNASAAIPDRNLRVDVVLTNASSLGGAILWNSNRIDVSALFPLVGMLPEKAELAAKDFRVDARDFDLRGYSNVVGTLDALWEHGTFKVQLRANATPLPTSTNLQPFVATISAFGDTNSATLDTFMLSSPGMDAHLSAPLAFNFKGEMLNSSAAFVVKADLAKQNFLPIRGFVAGTASLKRKPGTYPQVSFDVSGRGVTGFNFETAEMKTQGQLDWPMLELQNLNVQFVNGTTAKIATDVNLETRIIRQGTIEFSGKIGEDFIPVGYDYERLSLRAEFSGPLRSLKHSGDLSLGEVVVPYIKTFRASATWNGEGTDIKDFHVLAQVSGNARARIAGSAELVKEANTQRIRANLDTLELTSGDQTFALQTDVEVSAEFTRTNKHVAWNAQTTSIQLKSPRSDLIIEGAVTWPNAGRCSIYGHGLDTQVLNPFLIRPLSEVHLDQITAAATWSNAPAKWNIDTTTQLVLPATNSFYAIEAPFVLRAQIFGDANGTIVTNVTVSQNRRIIASASGTLPMTLEPPRVNRGVSNLVQLQMDQPIQFQATSVPNEQFWDAITKSLPLKLHSPVVDLAVTGTLREPRGTIRFEVPAGTLKVLANSAPLAIANLKANVTLDRHQIHLLQLDTLIEGQPLWATATLPIPDDIRHDWKKLFDWRHAMAQVRANDVEIAPFADLQRRFISPEGTVWANVRIDNGKIDGSIVVTNAATRPIAQFGAIRDINARLRFAQGRVDIERCAGNLSGGPVAVSGWAELSRIDHVSKLPAFELKFRGDSVPVVRRSDVIVRTAFDIDVANTNNGPGLVSGTVNLQNSYILNDLKLLVPPHVAKPQNRPPYFSVDTKPFADWKLDVNVKGNQFLKVRSPFFNGDCSTDMHLGGTLAEPVALGDATINTGEVQFPFANVKVIQGFITLTAAHPYMPYLFITGSTKAYDYDIRMNVTGPVDDPKIEFTSTPGLPSEQILVMLTAGELPATASALTMQQRTLRVGAFVGKNLLSRFGVAPGSEQRLTIQSGRDLSEQNTETYSIEYKVSPDWSIIGDYNRFGGLNLGLKWRFFSE